MKRGKVKKRSQGIITIPFLLVLIIILFLTLSLLGLAMTFVHISVSQYMSYSTARKLSLAGISEIKQTEAAKAHYEKLRGQFFSPGAHVGGQGDWFQISKQVHTTKNMGFNTQQLFSDSNTKLGYRQMFYGAGLNFSSKILKFEIPGLVKKDQASSKRLREPMRILSYLGREPSQEEECQNKFNKDRGEKICHLAASKGISSCNKQVISHPNSLGDNGC